MMKLKRRSWLRLGLVSAGVLALAGGGLALWSPGAPLDGAWRLRPAAQTLFKAVGVAVLEGSLPDDSPARTQALDGLLARLDGLVAALPAHARAELAQLLGVLTHPLGRQALAGLTPDWADASTAQVQAALQGMRSSSLALRQQAYQALHDLVGGAYFSDPVTWEALGYPGPRQI
jgi:hypothetical protein